ncbi:complex I intermediate-associated protein 30-domain-containing protein [Tribonema minus]|uniref:Complex I intermediate-associated protein 30-domain-containing protein n=1 Tax=Tribonema minus TaxID=303371 RepID=A0A836C8E7_9STRA|nr:complex I intermediate-associated protein 30-domain-containing protein [Tribonema minus]
MKAACTGDHASDPLLNDEGSPQTTPPQRPDMWTILDMANGPPSAPGWMRMDDGVMGGVSSSTLVYDDTEKCMTFTGHVSLERNGGFASTRSQSWQGWDFAEAKGIGLLAKGDGRLYKLSIKTDDAMSAVVYEHDFRPSVGQYQECRLNFKDFKPTFRGRLVPGSSSLDGSRVRQVGFMCSKLTDSGAAVHGFEPGHFKLDIRKLSAYK